MAWQLHGMQSVSRLPSFPAKKIASLLKTHTPFFCPNFGGKCLCCMWENMVYLYFEALNVFQWQPQGMKRFSWHNRKLLRSASAAIKFQLWVVCLYWTWIGFSETFRVCLVSTFCKPWSNSNEFPFMQIKRWAAAVVTWGLGTGLCHIAVDVRVI